MMAKRSIHDAAAALYKTIRAPRGTVNTMAFTHGRSKVIRVLVDPMYRLLVNVPSTFMGYRVVVEEKRPTIAYQQA